MNTTLRSAVARFAYPLLLAWPIVLSTLAVRFHLLPRPGFEGMLRELALVAVCLGPAIATLHFLERTMRWRDDMVPSREDRRTDLMHLAAIWLAISPIAQGITKSLVGLVAGRFTWASGAGIWPSSWPLPLQLALAVLVAEFGHYWFHRLMHETELGWRLHATHHGTPQVYWMNSTRFHALEVILNTVVMVGPLMLLGCSREAFIAYGLYTSVQGFTQHSNVAMNTRPFSWLLATPENHRWHHSTILDEGNRNYGVAIVLFDQIFGTWFCPKNREFTGPVGIGDLPDFPRSYVEQQLTPFRWRKLPRRSMDSVPAQQPAQQEVAVSATAGSRAA